MGDPSDSFANVTPGPGAGPEGDVLRSCTQRLRALRSAWGALAPSGFGEENHVITEAGRDLSRSLSELSADPSCDAAAVVAFEAHLGDLEREMRDVALETPVDRLRSTLPERLAVDRRSVLDLLDLVLSAEIAGLDGTRARIPTLDYLITLLCTGGDPGAPLQDPVTLTPRLHAICQSADVEYDARLPELEAAFYAAADLGSGEVREEIAFRTLRRQKVELGSAFFAPRVLRAITTYNAALQDRIDEEVLSSQDWGIPSSEEAPGEDTSVFDSPALRQLADALRRRNAGDPPAHSSLDRVAWCLDLTYLTGPEREALRSESTGHSDGLEGTTVLVGLLLRSAVVLDEEFPAIGIAPDQLSGAWVAELDDALRQDTNRRITGDDYGGACVLTDLKSRFLAHESADVRRVRARPARAATVRKDVPEAAKEAPKETPKKAPKETAEQLTSAALDSLQKEEAPGGLGQWPWRKIARTGVAGLLAFFALAQVNTILWGGGRVDSSVLEEVSPFLADGRRSEDGAGSAFTGTLRDVWGGLGIEEQTLAAQELVEALRDRGMNDVMIYDGERRLRIQALGTQPPRVVD